MLDLVAAFVLDLALGDPRWFPHPVRLIGRLSSTLEKWIRMVCTSQLGLRLGGILLTTVVVSLSFISGWLLLQAALRLNTAVYHAVNIVLIYSLLCTRSLGEEAHQVYRALQADDLIRARLQLSRIVGRDTEDLSSLEVSRAVVETVAENLVDGIIAPLLFIMLGGAPLGLAYKAVNTLDSMVGYRNETYRYLGWASARLDDMVNWIPARLAGWGIIPLAAWLNRLNFRNALRMVGRDARNHDSPNSGYPEAAFAGALGIQIGGSNFYFGKPVYKPTIGDGNLAVPGDIPTSIKLMYTSSIMTVVLVLIFLIAITGCNLAASKFFNL
ncbi:MAG: adenosylcobinamide-phosphate synthase CbiB [Syntrophomonadaceae bacterium]|nr:adenosylcobinamide-phosphate synthase CbiB [Syntrophomonadaceae bacterium]